MVKVLPSAGPGAAWKVAKLFPFHQSKATSALQLQILDLITWKARFLGVISIMFSCDLRLKIIEVGELNERQGFAANQ